MPKTKTRDLILSPTISIRVRGNRFKVLDALRAEPRSQMALMDILWPGQWPKQGIKQLTNLIDRCNALMLRPVGYHIHFNRLTKLYYLKDNLDAYTPRRRSPKIDGRNQADPQPLRDAVAERPATEDDAGHHRLVR